MSEEAGWVTGPALEIVFALRAIEVGDHVQLGGNLAAESIDYGCQGHVARIYRHNHHPGRRDWIYSGECECGVRWSIPNRIITAWKPKRVG